MCNPIAFARRFIERALDTEYWYESARKAENNLRIEHAAHRATLVELDEARAVIVEQQRELEEYELEDVILSCNCVYTDEIDEDPPQEPDLVPVEEHRERWVILEDGFLITTDSHRTCEDASRYINQKRQGPFRVRLERVEAPCETEPRWKRETCGTCDLYRRDECYYSRVGDGACNRWEPRR